MIPTHLNNLAKCLSVVVPAFNEELNIRETLRNIVDAQLSAKHVSNVEIIVVNDASSDQTLSIVEQFVSESLGSTMIKILNFENNLGVGRAFWIGSKVASGEFVTLVPGDGVFSTESLANLFSNFSPYGVTLTARKNKYQRHRFRRLISNLIGTWFSWLVDKRVKDPHSLFVFPTKAVTEAYEAIWPNINDDEHQRIGFEYHLQILQWILKTYQISKTIDIDVSTKLEESSNSTSTKALLNFLKHYGRMTMNKLHN